MEKNIESYANLERKRKEFKIMRSKVILKGPKNKYETYELDVL